MDIEIVKSLVIKNTSCKVNLIHVRISDIQERAEEIIQLITDTSWLSRLRPVSKRTYSANAKRTITKLVTNILRKVDDEVTEDFGEYLVSISAQDALVHELSHGRIPLSEILKEKSSKNHGFDFHTESPSAIIIFGESKYSGSENPYNIALSQICDFIKDKKNDTDFEMLENFVTPPAMENAINEQMGYAASFSMNSNRPNLIFSHALKSDHVKELVSNPELYLIGVEVIAN